VLQPIRKLETAARAAPAQVATQLEAQGWSPARPVPGFRLASCVKRPADRRCGLAPGLPEVLQAVYSDGLTHVSLFIEPFDAARHRKDLQAQFGATHSLAAVAANTGSRRWVTCRRPRCKQFVDALERRP
jgi:sigma-E factor negative regulatory protein RseB